MNIKNCNVDRLGKYKLAFFSIFILISLFTTKKDLIFPCYFKIFTTAVFAGIFVVFLFLMLFKTKLSFDLISLILLSRLVIYLIPLTLSPTMEGYWGNYFTTIGSFLAYTIASQVCVDNNGDYSKIMSKIIMIFLGLTSVEVIYMFFLINSKYGTLNINLFKYYLVTPIGGSNYIACIILPLMIFVFLSDIKKKFKIISITLAITALLIIKSKNAIFVLIIFFVFILIKKYLKVFKNIKNNRKITIILTLLLSISGLYIIYLAFNYLLIKWNMGMTYSGSSIYETINALSSNRLNVFSEELSRWTNHPIIGNGLGYKLGVAGGTRSHNWLIELLAQSGLLGFAVYLSALILWYKRIHKQKHSNKFIEATYYSIIIILIQGLAEVSIFTLTIDVILWFFIGLSVSESKVIEFNTIKRTQSFLMEMLDEK